MGEAQRAEEVIIARAGKPVARLAPYEVCAEVRHGGQWRGKVRMSKDFDSLPEDIAMDFGIKTDKQKKVAK